MSSLCDRKRVWGLGSLALVLLMAASASAETLLMPKRDFKMGTADIVWGVTTQANGTAYVIDFGDGSQSSGNVSDRSYIFFSHSFPISGVLNVQLCVGPGAAIPGCTGELATVTVNVFNTASLSASELRGLNINIAIEDGLRYFWTSQTNRATNFPNGVTTNWPGSYSRVVAALAALAFENHGYLLPNNDSAPVGVYQKYIVRRALNYVIDELQTATLTVQTAGDPCVNVEAAPCIGLFQSFDATYSGYETSIAALPLAGSAALSRHVAEIAGTRTGGLYAKNNNLTYGQVLQRVINAQAWGQIDTANQSRGGWGYTLNTSLSDGSTLGWNMLALLDSEAAGITVPAFVKTEYTNFAGANHQNADGTFDYNPNTGQATGGPSTYINMARSGIGLQSLFYRGHIGTGDAAVAAGVGAVNTRWVTSPNTDYLDTCGSNVNTNNKGCGYAMFNVFKGLKLHGVTSLPAAADWYAEYQDYLVTTQTSPTSSGGGNWGSLLWSCCGSMPTQGPSALAELILAPVALVQPDPTLFSTVGLTPFTDTNPVGTDHTVTALVQSSNNAPIPGATVGFTVLSGPNAGASGTCAPVGCVSGADGKVSFTYHDSNGAGHDTIQANIGAALKSNIVDKFWIVPTLKCDADGNGTVQQADLVIIRNANGTVASGPTDPRDGNGDGVINVLDVRYCQLRLGQTSGVQ